MPSKDEPISSTNGESSADIQTLINRILTNNLFEFFVVIIITISALVIGVKTYDLPPAFTKMVSVLDRSITFIFLTEILMRILGEKNKMDFLKKGWNVFDTIIVVVSLVPIENSEMAIIGRLVRIFRVLRMISIIPELRTLLNSLLKALPQLGYVMLLMFIIFYIYGAVGSTFFSSINQDLWGDIAISMLTLFRVMTFEDWTDVMYETMEVYPISWCYYVTFIFLTAFAFLNMIIGIVVNVLEEEHKLEREEKAEELGEPTIKDLQNQIMELKSILQAQNNKS